MYDARAALPLTSTRPSLIQALHTGAADLGKALVDRMIQPFACILLIQLDSQGGLPYPHCGKRL